MVRRMRQESNSIRSATDVPLSLEQPAPLSVLMKSWKKPHSFREYNAEELKAAGIDLERRSLTSKTSGPRVLQIDVRSGSPGFLIDRSEPAGKTGTINQTSTASDESHGSSLQMRVRITRFWT